VLLQFKFELGNSFDLAGTKFFRLVQQEFKLLDS